MRWNEGHNIITMEAECLADIYPWWNLKEFGNMYCSRNQGGTSTLVILKQLLTVGPLGFQLGAPALLPGFEIIYTELAEFASSKIFINS